MDINTIPIKKLVEFTRYSERRQVNFANSLKIPKVKEPVDKEGGDYWIRSLSGIAAAFKANDSRIIKDRISALADDYRKTTRNQTKVMYERNLEILHSYQDYDFSIYHPPFELEFLSKPQKPLLENKKIPIRVTPHHLFRFKESDELKAGGIWFVTWLDGFKMADLGMYAESLFKYASINYSSDHIIEPKYCLVVDAVSKEIITYDQVLNGEVPRLYSKTVDALGIYLFR